jgi:hypothetical protein
MNVSSTTRKAKEKAQQTLRAISNYENAKRAKNPPPRINGRYVNGYISLVSNT